MLSLNKRVFPGFFYDRTVKSVSTARRLPFTQWTRHGRIVSGT